MTCLQSAGAFYHLNYQRAVQILPIGLAGACCAGKQPVPQKKTQPHIETSEKQNRKGKEYEKSQIKKENRIKAPLPCAHVAARHLPTAWPARGEHRQIPILLQSRVTI